MSDRYKTTCDVCGASAADGSVFSFTENGELHGRCREHLDDDDDDKHTKHHGSLSRQTKRRSNRASKPAST